MSGRRDFLKCAGVLAAGLPLASALPARAATGSADSDEWASFRQQFELAPGYLHMANFLVTSHPKVVRDAIEGYRAQLDANPGLMMDWDLQIGPKNEHNVREWAGRYLNVKPGQVALTESTTQGLGLVYAGLHIAPGQEILSTVHEHSAAKAAMNFRHERDGTPVRRIELFKDAHSASREEILANLATHLRPETRVIGLTWVHSGSGVKLPIGEIGRWIAQQNHGRKPQARILFVVDGVHGLGVEDVDFADLNCDFFIAGTHKWMFGPRGTGIVCSARETLDDISQTLPTFNERENFGTTMSPGGYHAFEHRWALAKAFELHLQLGKARVQGRIHQLNSYCKQRLARLPNLELVTPLSPELSAGFTFFRLKGEDQDQVAAWLLKNRVITDAVDRDAGPVVRLAPGLLNTEAQIDQVVALLAQRYPS